MTHIRIFVAGVWEFVVGDDWRLALGVALALGVIALLAVASVSAWWAMPPTVLALLWISIRRAAREALRVR